MYNIFHICSLLTNFLKIKVCFAWHTKRYIICWNILANKNTDMPSARRTVQHMVQKPVVSDTSLQSVMYMTTSNTLPSADEVIYQI